MIHLIFGRPGTGKTYTTVERIREAIADGSRRIYLIVPEQQAYSAERNILSTLPLNAGKCFSILSFSRLCNLLSDRFGGRSSHNLSRAMRTLLMWQSMRELKGIPEIYKINTTDDTLCRKMLSETEKLAINAISSDQLEAVAEQLPAEAPLRGKLRDFALISSTYNDLVSNVLGENPADRMLRAAAQIEEHNFFENAVVFIDSFTSFTAQEYAILRHIIKQAYDVTLTVGCGSRHDTEPQFESMKDTVHRITRICKDAKKPYEDILLTEDHRRVSPELALLEKMLWNYETIVERLPAEGDRGHVHVTVAPTVYDEAEAAALHILELHDAGIPYEEIALVVRDTSAWTGVIDAALQQYHIPFFLSERTDLNQKPAARLLLTALRAIARHWQADDLVALCKTGLCGVTPRETDYFAEYTDTWHLSGRRMTDTAWSMNPDGYTLGLSNRGKVILESANRVRETIMTPLITLELGLRSAQTVADQCRALFAYLTELSIKQKLMQAAEEHMKLGQVREAGEVLRLWGFLTETLASVASMMESCAPMTANELACALSLVFDETDIGSVPARHDCVTIGSAATLRVDNIRALLVLGLCEGEFPQSIEDNGLFSEQDKDVLSAHDIELDPPSSRRLSEELLHVWRSISTPSEQLYLSYSTASPDGSARSPSVAIGRVLDVLPYLKATAFSSRMMGRESVRHRAPLNDSISRPAIRKILGEQIWLSQSKLSAYARCPYRYYASHLLRLRERAEAKLNNRETGLFLHHVVEQYLLHTLDKDNHILPMKPAEARELADAIIEKYVREIAGESVTNGRFLHLFDRMRQIALVLINSIQAELSTSDFSVAGVELDLHSRKPGGPKSMSISLDSQDIAVAESFMKESQTLSSDQELSFTESFMAANYPENRTPAAESGENGLPTTTPVQNLTPDGVMGLPITTPPEESPVQLLLEGRVDRVDFFRSSDGETVYVRVVDYKSSEHDLSLSSIQKDMDIQLLLYLFSLCSPENRALFTDKDGRVPTRVLPAAAVYMYPKESGDNGAISTLRTGITISEAEVVEAVSHDPAAVYVPSAKRDESGKLVGKGLISSEDMAKFQDVLVETIKSTAAAIYSGCAHRTPTSDACGYCRLKDVCEVRAEKSY